MKRFGMQLSAVMMRALPAQTVWAFEHFYTPTFNQIPNLRIVGSLREGAVSQPVAGNPQFGVFQGKAEVDLSAAPDLQAANPSARSQTKGIGFNESLFLMKRALRDATTAVRSHAENVRQKIERALADTDQLVGNLESDEGEAAGESS